LVNYTRILPAEEFTVPRLGALCFHPSMLPRHRGRDAVWWAVHQGDEETGVTWFWLDAGIDTGDIAIQQAVKIPEGTTPGRLYYTALVPLGIELLAELLPRLTRGDIPRMPQDESQATYEPPRPAEPILKIDARKWITE
jgi:methionyl-tRNA formyltransferase